jgi:hypothetical protein
LGPFYQPREEKKGRLARSTYFYHGTNVLDPSDVLPITTNFLQVSVVDAAFLSSLASTTRQGLETDRPSAVTVGDWFLETTNGLFPFSWPQASFNSTVSPTVEGFLLPRPPISSLYDRQVRDPVASVLPLPHFELATGSSVA